MIVEFIVGVNTFSFDPIIVTIWLERLEKVLNLCPNTIGLTSLYSIVLGYPVGFVCTKALFK